MAHNPRSVGNWILFAFTAQHALISYLIGLLLFVTFFAHKIRFEQAGVMTMEWREWFATGRDGKGPYQYSTTILRLIVWNPGARDDAEELDDRVERHETVHLRQFEDAAVQGFVLGLALATAQWTFGWYAEAWQPALVWELVWLAMPLMAFANWITAVMRFGVAPKREGRSWFDRIFDVAYRDSEHERSAYAQTDRWPNGESWWQGREDRRQQ